MKRAAKERSARRSLPTVELNRQLKNCSVSRARFKFKNLAKVKYYDIGRLVPKRKV